MSHGHWMKIAVLLFTSTLPSLAKAQVGVEQPSETYWHLISDSGRPAVYLQYAGLTQDEISKGLACACGIRREIPVSSSRLQQVEQ